MESQLASDEQLTVSGGKHRSDRGWARSLVLIYFFSGVASVAYEILWVRMLSLQFGVGIFSVIVTVVAFMAGLGAGSLAGTVLSRRTSRPLVIFAGLEAAVAIFALCMPLLFQQLDTWLGAMSAAGGLDSWFVVQAGAAFLILVLPATAMGAGFPLILRALSPASVSLARVYGVNTLGGATGALLPLALLPAIGWTHAVQVVAATGIGIAVSAVLLGRWAPTTDAAPAPVDADAGRPSLTTLFAYAGIGLAALMLQIGWTRLFGMFMLRTEYVLAIVLAVFLVGIGLGSLCARWRPANALFAWFPPLASLAALVTLWLLPVLAAWADQAQFGSMYGALISQGLVIACLTLPVTLIMGAWLPLLTGRLGGSAGSMSGAWLYGVNSLGAAGGALLAGLVLVPWLGTAATIVIAALLLFLFGMWWATSRQMWFVGAALLVAAVPVTRLPDIDILLPVTQAGSHQLDVHEDALSITHVVEQPDGQRLLLSDLRRMDASSDPVAVVAQQNQARLPLLLHREPHTVLYLGLGTGISAAGASDLPDLSVVAVELTQGAINAAANWFAPVNGDITQTIDVVRDDARRFLRITPQRYDVIIGDLFHPDLVGRSNLLSIQQFRRAKDRLEHDGVFTQWLALNQFDTTSLAIVLRSFKEVFADHMLFVDGFRLALVGFKEPWPGVPDILDKLQRLNEHQRASLTGGEGVWTWLGRYWGRIPETTGPVQDDWVPKIEFRLPRARYTREFDLSILLEQLLPQRPSVEEAVSALNIPPLYLPEFDRAYIASELAIRSWLASLHQQSQESQRLLRIAYQANSRDRWITTDLADRMLASLPQAIAQGIDKRSALEEILTASPDHVAALKALRAAEFERGNTRRADELRAHIVTLAPLDKEIKEFVR